MDSTLLAYVPMTIREIRRQNLLALIGSYGTIEALADACGKPASYLSQIKNDTRGMGSNFARDVEQALQLSDGWMDNAPGAGRNNGVPIPVEVALFRRLSRKQREAITLILKSMVAGR